ncbi:Uncharacterised protein [Mycobacterium tuberculosis]|uniref:Uncharacterized protein n=1 Tax=Mycobacterium tuberculosis TaxID=1773 RepID=A0A916L7J3_MYCTX|nr:Uncharacterised protein [Mycobacterium tuberculosis]
MVSPTTQVTQFKPSFCKMSGTAKKVRLASSTALSSPVVPLVKIIASGSSLPWSAFPARLAASKECSDSRVTAAMSTAITGIECSASGTAEDAILLPGATRAAAGSVI